MSENQDPNPRDRTGAGTADVAEDGRGEPRSVTNEPRVGEDVSAPDGVGTTAPPGKPNSPVVDPTWGYSALSEDEVSPALRVRVDHVVELGITAPSRRGPGADNPFDFVFDPVGLAVDPGGVVKFLTVDAEHTVTAYHDARARQRRVPEGVRPFSSPMQGPGMAWLYEFEIPGVYDVFCAPHEERSGTVMRVVVGDGDPSGYRMDDPPLGPLGFARDVLSAPELDPESVVEDGRVEWADLTL